MSQVLPSIALLRRSRGIRTGKAGGQHVDLDRGDRCADRPILAVATPAPVPGLVPVGTAPPYSTGIQLVCGAAHWYLVSSGNLLATYDLRNLPFDWVDRVRQRGSVTVVTVASLPDVPIDVDDLLATAGALWCEAPVQAGCARPRHPEELYLLVTTAMKAFNSSPPPPIRLPSPVPPPSEITLAHLLGWGLMPPAFFEQGKFYEDASGLVHTKYACADSKAKQVQMPFGQAAGCPCPACGIRLDTRVVGVFDYALERDLTETLAAVDLLAQLPFTAWADVERGAIAATELIAAYRYKNDSFTAHLAATVAATLLAEVEKASAALRFTPGTTIERAVLVRANMTISDAVVRHYDAISHGLGGQVLTLLAAATNIAQLVPQLAINHRLDQAALAGDVAQMMGWLDGKLVDLYGPLRIIIVEGDVVPASGIARLSCWRWGGYLGITGKTHVVMMPEPLAIMLASSGEVNLRIVDAGALQAGEDASTLGQIAHRVEYLGDGHIEKLLTEFRDRAGVAPNGVPMKWRPFSAEEVRV